MRGQVSLLQDFLQSAPGAPAIVPVGGQGILLTDPGVQPVVHQPASLGGDHRGIQALGFGKDLEPVGLRLKGKQLRTGGTDDLDVQFGQIRKDADYRGHGAGALYDHRTTSLTVRIRIPDHVSAPGRFEVRWNPQSLTIRNLDFRPGEVQRHHRRVLLQCRCQQHRHLIELPGMQVDDLTTGKHLGHSRSEDTEVGAAVVGCLRPGMAGHPEHLAQPPITVLGQLAEQPHHTVQKVGEGTVGGGGSPESPEISRRILGEIHAGQSGHDTGVGELGDLLGQQCPFFATVAFVPSVALERPEGGAETADIGGAGQISRAGQEQGLPVLLCTQGVDPGPPTRQGFPVGPHLPGLSKQLRRISLGVVQSRIGERAA